MPDSDTLERELGQLKRRQDETDAKIAGLSGDRAADADRIQSRRIQDEKPTDKDVLKWDEDNNRWGPDVGADVLSARATADLALGTTSASITGDGDSSKVRVLLPTIAEWVILGTFDLDVQATDPANLIGSLHVDDSATAETGLAVFSRGDQKERATVTQVWIVTTTAVDTPVEMKAKKIGAGGTGVCRSTHTTLVAITGIGGGTASVSAADHGDLAGLGDTSDHAYATLVDGTRAFTGEQSMGTNKLTEVVDPTVDQDAATKKYHDDNKYTDAEAVTAVEAEATLSLKAVFVNSLEGILAANLLDKSAIETIRGGWTFDEDVHITAAQVLFVDTLNEESADSGVTIDGVLLKDSIVATAALRGLRESGGQALDMGAVADGEFLKRVGTDIVGAAAGGNHDMLDGSIHQDSVADAVTRGSIIYGNSTPKWDELVVGAANSVLWTDGTDVSWSAAPRLANIADTGGTNRIKIGTSSPHVEIDDTLRCESLGIGFAPPSLTGYRITAISTGETFSASVKGIEYQIANAIADANNITLAGFSGQVVTAAGSGTARTGVKMYGLSFQVAAQNGHASSVIAELAGLQTKVGFVNINHTVTAAATIWANAPVLVGGTGTVDSISGLLVKNQAVSIATAVYGVNIEDQTGGTAAYGVYIEDADDYAIWSDAGLNRFDGDGTHVFELPADATDPTGGGGAAAGRIPVTIGGATKYIAYY